ncbi:MAG: type I restriction-modification system subunit M, partial [Firmicutes bacterium]|nr:type I restriction-modification system subunit M [Bacillota bacterium]
IIDYKDLRWQNFKNEEPSKMFVRMRDYIFPFMKSLSGGKDTAFARYMKDSIFMIPTPRILVKVIDGLDALDMTDKDSMGDVYEYLLFKIASSGENGQFRTPRHIIDMMVRLMKPTLQDTICDPAMGSAGFIASSANFITEQDKPKGDLLKRENQERFQNQMFTGFDTDPTMLRIGAMNMMLHGVENPHIEYRDSLSDENEDRNKYSLILANPPFTGSLDFEAVSKDLLALCKTKKTELLFLSLFIKMLEVGGRCASIVPDGVLFGSSTAHKAIREELVEKQSLTAVISMPSGVFKPYAGVSTAILIFTKTNAGGTDKVWFYDMKADGFSLDDKRSQVAQNDIPDIIARYNNLGEEEGRARTDQSFFIDKAEIVANGYDLSINKYKKTEYIAEVFDTPANILAEIMKLNAEVAEDLKRLEGGA